MSEHLEKLFIIVFETIPVSKRRAQDLTLTELKRIARQ
jgi:hypothetical protein